MNFISAVGVKLIGGELTTRIKPISVNCPQFDSVRNKGVKFKDLFSLSRIYFFLDDEIRDQRTETMNWNFTMKNFCLSTRRPESRSGLRRTARPCTRTVPFLVVPLMNQNDLEQGTSFKSEWRSWVLDTFIVFDFGQFLTFFQIVSRIRHIAAGLYWNL